MPVAAGGAVLGSGVGGGAAVVVAALGGDAVPDDFDDAGVGDRGSGFEDGADDDVDAVAADGEESATGAVVVGVTGTVSTVGLDGRPVNAR